jgi:hypothetical protein
MRSPMSETLEFILHGTINGEKITPRTINLSQFNEFNQQVEQFIAGRFGTKLDTVHVLVQESSYGLSALMEAPWIASWSAKIHLEKSIQNGRKS